MRTHSLFVSTFEPIAVACPLCKHLMFFKSFEPTTLLYGHQLDQYTFRCGDCGRVVTHTVDEDFTTAFDIPSAV